MPTRITDKDEIMRLAIEYLKNNNRIDILSFIHNDMGYLDAPDSFIMDVAHKMQRTGKYEIDGEHFPHYVNIKPLPIKEKTWKEQHPVLSDFRTAGIGALASLIVSAIIYLLPNHKQDLKDTQQDGRIDSLSDSIRRLQMSMPTKQDTSKPLTPKK